VGTHADEGRLLPRDTARFEDVVLPHLDAAYTLSRYLLRDEADAQDAVQDAFVRAMSYFASYRGGDARAWLLRIVRNVCHDAMRRRRALAADELGDDVADEGAEDDVVRGLDRSALHRAIDALPTEYREVIVLREIEGMSYAEIAQVADVPAGTVMSRLSRARRRLQEALNPAPRPVEGR
jgi:RNA polymerase sigma-70 factor (ECF subfamily)